MMHHGPRAAGLLAITAALLLAPGAFAATPAKSPASAKAKESAYGKHCPTKHKAPKRAAQRTKCLDAMAKLATGKSSSPSKACSGLGKKKAKRDRKSAYARCVSEGAKLLKAKRRGGSASGSDDLAGDDLGLDEDESDEALEDLDEPLDDAGPDDDAAGDDEPAPERADDDSES